MQWSIRFHRRHETCPDYSTVHLICEWTLTRTTSLSDPRLPGACVWWWKLWDSFILYPYTSQAVGFHGLCLYTYTFGAWEQLLVYLKGGKRRVKERYLTFYIDSSPKVQILFLWGQEKVNVPPPSPTRPLTYLASQQTHHICHHWLFTTW